MLKVLIIDDEPIVREGLQTIIDWQKYDYSICGEGKDGKDGLNKILELKPDLVLADIKMPGMSGIELISEAKSHGFSGKCIILSGYSDFKYAQSAIKLGVKSYLLKPIEEEELIESIEKVHKEIAAEKEVKECVDTGRRQVIENLLRKLVLGELSNENLKSQLQSHDLNFNFKFFCAAVIEEHISDTVMAALLSESSSKDVVEVFRVQGKTVFIFKASHKDIYNLVEIYYREHISNNFQSRFMSVGRIVSDASHIDVSYKDAKGIMENKFLYAEDKIVFWKEPNNETHRLHNFNMELLVDKIYTAVEVGELDEIEHIIDELRIYFESNSYNSEKIKGLMVAVINELNKRFAEINGKGFDVEAIVNEIYEQTSLIKLLDYIKGEINSVMKLVSNSSSKSIMKHVLNYIGKNYHKDLKLEMLAEIFNYNSAYLGKIFRNYTGESFNSYLDKIRIENAKMLLNKKDIKVYQVSENVGYKNIDYFYSKFKKYVGVSPKEFKKNMG